VIIATNINTQKEAALQVKQRAEQLATIVEIGRAVSTLQDLESVLEIIYQQVQHIAPVDTFFICLLNADKKHVSFPLTYDMGVRYNEPDSQLRPGSRVATVIQTGEPYRYHRTPEDIAAAEKDTNTVGHPQRRSGSLLFVPLWQAHEVIGVLSIQSYALNAYPDELVKTMAGVGDQAAIAIQNARLFTNIQQELSERKRAEAAQENLIEELGNKNAELERFTYTVSHDLRNPIVTIKGFLGMLTKDMEDNRPDYIQSDIRRIAGAADKMDALLKDLLELSRIGRIVNPPAEVDTVKLTHEALEMLNARIRSKNAQVIVSPNLPSIYCDQIRLREVLENLIDNAIKCMGEQPEPQIEIGVRNEDKEAVIFVKDNGIGIDSRYHERVFRLFEKLNPTSEGTGIGLALVKRIVEVHGGKIWVESDGLGKGSTFCFTIPDNRK
jgi:signal transduction histidine kinase